ncbi:hypothetical protein CCHR01_18065 [Colletotrichum chrysophilum]|uniref:Uncharacterized protein n=1 Tax=Colletotrichum chrysophilum TaxID=1836956 RepID=A0AAD9E9A0_9PEZI|nr:hypothetical protein CCHR01_18065 [Colletotrichum chrysophilum]
MATRTPVPTRRQVPAASWPKLMQVRGSFRLTWPTTPLRHLSFTLFLLAETHPSQKLAHIDKVFP